MQEPQAWYREFVPCEALRGDVYAFYSFVPGAMKRPAARSLRREIPFRASMACAPQLADGHVSIRFELGRTMDGAGRWRAESTVVEEMVSGPMSRVGRTASHDLCETVGAYLRPGASVRFFDLPLSDLSDATIAIDDVWNGTGRSLSARLMDLSEPARIAHLEATLLAQRRSGRIRYTAVDVKGLAATVLETHGRLGVSEMARLAGVSRQHLTRLFREQIGVAPNLYRRLARFHSLLAYAGSRARPDWAAVAVDAGFSDQSHLIAECRRFSGLTSRALAENEWFHPFIERARSRRARLGGRLTSGA